MATAGNRPAGFVDGDLIIFNDNGAWCWFQNERVIFDPGEETLLIGSVASDKGKDGKIRGGNIELTYYNLATKIKNTVILHRYRISDDHNAPALFLRPDGRYLAMYTGHYSDTFSRMRISSDPNDASEWKPEMAFDWSAKTGGHKATYSNLYYLSSEDLLYNFSRVNNRDQNIMVSGDWGDTWNYGGKLFDGYSYGLENGYVRYVSNEKDRIDVVATESHPQIFNNSIYHGYIKNGALHRSDGTMADDDIFDDKAKPQIVLTKVLAAGSSVAGDTITHLWVSDLRLDRDNTPVAILTGRAKDVPENSNFSDHRFLYARYDSGIWHVNQLAKAGPPLWKKERDYTGLATLDPDDPDTVWISTPVDPRDSRPLAHYEIFRGRTADRGKNWKWVPVTWNSKSDNLRPIAVSVGVDRVAILWYRGKEKSFKHYKTQVVGIIKGR